MNLTHEQVEELGMDQDLAAQEFWAYPGHEWQVEFQAGWLQRRFGVTSAQSSNLVFGE